MGDTNDGERLTFLRRSFNGSNTAFSTTEPLPDFSQNYLELKQVWTMAEEDQPFSELSCTGY